MFFLKILSAIVAACMLACAAPESSLDDSSAQTASPATYRLLLDPSLSVVMQEYAIAAAQAWQSVVPIQFEIVVTACMYAEPSPATFCVYPIGDVTNSDTSFTTYGETDVSHLNIGWAGIMIVQNDIPPSVIQQTMLHEFGHAMGLNHQAAYVIMNPTAEGASPTITAGDVAQWHAVHGG